MMQKGPRTGAYIEQVATVTFGIRFNQFMLAFQRTLMHHMIQPFHNAFAGIAVRDIIFRLIKGGYLLLARYILGKTQSTMAAFPYLKIALGNGMILCG